VGHFETLTEVKRPVEGVGKILPAVLQKQLHRSDASLLELLAPLWPNVVGKGVARQCQPVSFASGTLTISTSCPTWAVQFRQLADEIRACINRFLGREFVKKLRVRVDPAMGGGDFRTGLGTNTPIDISSVNELGNAASLEPDVAHVMQQSYAKYFARGKRKVH
jgi:hypothetical protein